MTQSQYPIDSPETHVEYILVASFDIDHGSVMEHQYPNPIGGDEHMLAELMLPDQAHIRSQDWTIFFLHKDTSPDDEEEDELGKEEKCNSRRHKIEGFNKTSDSLPCREQSDMCNEGHDTDLTTQSDITGEDDEVERNEGEDDDDDDDTIDGPPLIYVLNLVNTKQDSTAKRGAIVKAMAICTRHSFLHIYKPLLLLALDEYFRAPTIETLASLYNAVNSMDLSLLPRLSPLERHILMTSDSKEMFIEKFDQVIKKQMFQDVKHESVGSTDSSVGSLTAVSTNQTGKKQNYSLPRDTHEFESRVLYNGVPVPIKVPTAVPPETVGDFSIIRLIQIFSTPHMSNPVPFDLHPHLTTFGPYTHPIIVLVNALLTQKRVIFLGHNMPSGDVAEAVLASCALASGSILRGFTRHAFPYTDLTKIDDLLKVPGFVAGVKNPAFAHKSEWWDLLCDLSTGRMKISNRIETPPLTEGLVYFQNLLQKCQGKPEYSSLSGLSLGILGLSGLPNNTPGHRDLSLNNDPTGDNAFMDALQNSIIQRQGEAAIRAKWRNYILRFTRLAAAFEECVYGASALYIGAVETDADVRNYGVSGHGICWPNDALKMRELAANASRIEGWRFTRSYYSFVQDQAREWRRGQSICGIDIKYQCDKLRSLKLDHDHSAAIYKALSKVVETAGLEVDDLDLADTSDPRIFDSDGSINPSVLERYRGEVRYDVINHLLLSLPENQGGLFYLGLGLFHPRADVRAETVKLLNRICDHPAGRHYWCSLGRFAKLAYLRIKREMDLTSPKSISSSSNYDVDTRARFLSLAS